MRTGVAVVSWHTVVFQIDHTEADAVDGRENGRPAVSQPPAPKSAVSLQLLRLPSASPDVLCPLMSDFGEEGESFTDYLSGSPLVGYTQAASKEHGQETGFITGPV